MAKYLTRYALLIALGLLSCQFAYQAYMAKADSQTTDEAVHLLAGYTYLTKQDFRFNSEHPPLIKMLSALPLLFQKINFADDGSYEQSGNFFYDSWAENRSLAVKWFYQMGNNPDQMLWWGRLPIIILTFLLGLSLFLIVRYVFNPLSALFVTTLFVFEPTINAHGHLITTDIGATLFYLLTIWFFYQFLQKRNFFFALLTGLFLGLALASKFTLIILPLILVVISICYFVFEKSARLHLKKVILLSVLIFLVSYFVVWLTYLFQTTPIPRQKSYLSTIQQINSYPLKENLITNIADKTIAVLRPVLQPAHFYKGMFMVVTHATSGHSATLFGKTSSEGWWYYFPVVFLAKTALPTLLAFALGLYLLIKAHWFRKMPGILFVIAILGYLAFAMSSKANLGVRHILPIYPFIIALASGITLSKLKNYTAIIGIIGIWALVNALIVFDYPISHYNILFGGTNNGYRIATDSNLDWGQDIKRIKRYMDKEGIIYPYIEYHWSGQASLDYYGLKSLPIENFTQQSQGTLIIGSSALYNPKYHFLLEKKPEGRITPSVFIYHLDGQ